MKGKIRPPNEMSSRAAYTLKSTPAVKTRRAFTTNVGATFGRWDFNLTSGSRETQIRARRSSCALIATTTVLADMSTAPSAGDRTIPYAASNPAASGMATML